MDYFIRDAQVQDARALAEILEGARQSRAVFEPEEWQMQAWISTYTAIASGAFAAPTDTVQNVLGRAPQTLEETLKKAQES